MGHARHQAAGDARNVAAAHTRPLTRANSRRRRRVESASDVKGQWLRRCSVQAEQPSQAERARWRNVKAQRHYIMCQLHAGERARISSARPTMAPARDVVHIVRLWRGEAQKLSSWGGGKHRLRMRRCSHRQSGGRRRAQAHTACRVIRSGGGVADALKSRHLERGLGRIAAGRVSV